MEHGRIAMRFGLKLWSINFYLLKEARKLIEKDIFQYIELTLVPNTPIEKFLEYDIPYILHAPTEMHGFNISDLSKIRYNLKIINECLRWADKLNAKYLIIHPGFGNILATKKFLEKLDDNRILIENMPKAGLNNEKMVGCTVEELEKLLNSKFSLCFDINHAIKASISLGENYKKFIKGFLKLPIRVVHISDGRLSNEKDEHLNIGEGEYDFGYIFALLSQLGQGSNYITLETPCKNSLVQYIQNFQKIKKVLTK